MEDGGWQGWGLVAAGLCRSRAPGWGLEQTFYGLRAGDVSDWGISTA